MVSKVTWPHEVVYMAEGKPAAYQDMCVPLLIQQHLITMDTQYSSVKNRMAEHLKDLVADAEIYRWEKTMESG